MLIDHGNEYAATLGLRHKLPDDLIDVYSEFGIKLPEYNGEDSWTLPMPARIIVDPDGVVRDADSDADYKIRPDPSETIAKVISMRDQT